MKTTTKLIVGVLLTFYFLLSTFNSSAQNIGINSTGAAPNASALLDIDAAPTNDKGVLLPRLTTAERNAIASPANSLLIFNTTTNCFEWWDSVGSAWVSMSCGSPPFTCGGTLAINHTIGVVAPETKSVNYGTVSSTLGGTGAKCWLTQNLGSTNQASSATDATDASAGWYWQFNRKQGYMVGPTPAWTITSINETSDWIAAQDPCTIELGAGWRIPTYTEWLNADATGTWDSYNHTYTSVLKIHAAGCLNNSDGSLLNRGVYGYYWSSTQYLATTSWFLYFAWNFSYLGSGDKAYSRSVRCLRD